MQQKLRLNAPKKQHKYYSGKKKKHTMKVQIVADEKTLKILCISFSEGKNTISNYLKIVHCIFQKTYLFLLTQAIWE